MEEYFDTRVKPLGMTHNEFVHKVRCQEKANPFRKYEQTGFATSTGKIELYSTIFDRLGYDPLPAYREPVRSLISDPELAKEFPLVLISGGRNRRYYHSQGRQLESLRKRDPDPIAQINPEAGNKLGIKDGDWMWIETPMGRVQFKCKYFRGIDPRVVQAEHGWWFPEESSLDALWRSNINAVVDDASELCDPVSGNFALRGQLCKVYKTED